MDANNINNQNENREVQADATNAEAKIGATYYLTLKEAMETVQNGETITLLRDAPLQTIANSDSDLTLDLNGHQVFKHTLSFSGHATIRDSVGGGAIISDVSSSGTLKNYAKVAGVLTNTGHFMNSGTVDKLIGEDGVVHNTGVITKGTLRGGAYHGDLDHIDYVISIGDVVYGSLASAAKDANVADEDLTIFVHERSTLKETVTLKNPDAAITIDMNGKTFLNGTINIASKVMVTDSSKRKKGNILSNIAVEHDGELHIESTVSGNINNEGTVINDGLMAGTNSNFGTLINNEEGEVTDTLISEGKVHNEGEMDYLYVRGGEADSTVEIRNVTVLAGHYQGEVAAVECKAAIGDTYFGDAFEAIDMAKTASEKVTVALYKETKLKEPLVIDNPKAPMVLDIHGQEVSGEDIEICSDVSIINSSEKKAGALFTNLIVREKGMLRFDADATKSVECFGKIINDGEMPYVIVHAGNVNNHGTVNKAVLEAGATFTGLAKVINSEAMIGKTHYMTFQEALEAAITNENNCTLSLLMDYSIEKEWVLAPKALMTLNLNNHSVTGGPLSIKTQVCLDNSGEQGAFECPIINTGRLENKAPLMTTLDNSGTLINDANINEVINTGSIENGFVITSLQMRSGEVLNKGTISQVIHNAGEINNQGAIDNLTIENERVEVEGHNPEVTNANIKIDNAYYTSLEGAIDDMNKAEQDVTVGFVKDLEIKQPLTLSNQQAKITFALNEHTLSGEKLLILTPVTFVHGTVDNDIENQSTLVNQATMTGYVRNLSEAINEGTMGRLDNKESFTNSGEIDTLVMKEGTCDNQATIRNLAMGKGKLDSSGVIEVISQKGGKIKSSGEVGHLEIVDGVFTGKLESTNAPMKLGDTYYAQVKEAIMAALKTQKPATVTLIDDLTLKEEWIIPETKFLLTFDLGGHTLSGERITNNGRFTLREGRVNNVFVNHGKATLEALMDGDMINDGSLTILDTCSAAILNKKTLLNNGTLNAVNNEGTLTNSGSLKTLTTIGTVTNHEDAIIDALVQNGGTVTNEGLIRNDQMSAGTLTTSGDVHYLSESGGAVTNTGEVDTLNLTAGAYHGRLHSTNASAHIDEDYYPTFEAAIDVANNADKDVTVSVIDGVIINNPLSIGANDHQIIIDLGKYSLSGGPLTTSYKVEFVSMDGTIKNRIINKGDLVLKTNMNGALTNEEKVLNYGMVASLINNGDCDNQGTVAQVANNGHFLNKAILKKITNTAEVINASHIDEIVQNNGTCDNQKFIAHFFMNKGLLTNQSRVVALKQFGGEVENKAQVEHLDMEAGRYVGPVEVSNAIAAIKDVRYARLNEAIEDANKADEDTEVSLRDHAQVLDQLTLGNPDHVITLNTNQSNVVGELLTLKNEVHFTGYGKITNGLYNTGTLVSEVLTTGEVMNEGTLINKKKMNGTVNNRGKMVNEDSVESLINRATLDNKGTIQAFTQTAGETRNEGFMTDVILDEGTLHNAGTLSRITQKGGQSFNTATVHTLLLSRGTFKGSVEDTNALARIDDVYYPYLEDAMQAASKAQEDVTVTLNNDVVVGDDLILDNASHLLTLDLDEHRLDGGAITCDHDTMIVNGTIGNNVVNKGTLKANATFEQNVTNTGTFMLDGHVKGTITNSEKLTVNGSANEVVNTRSLTNEGIIAAIHQDEGTLDNNGSIEKLTLNGGGLINGGGSHIATIAQQDGSVTNFGEVSHLEMAGTMVVFKGNPPVQTNAQAKILTNYYLLTSAAIDSANHTREGVKVILNNDVELEKDILFYNTEKAVILDLAGHQLSGASLTVASEVTFMGEGTIANLIDVTGLLTNETSLDNEVSVHGQLINKEHLARVIVDGELTNEKGAAIESADLHHAILTNKGHIATLHGEESDVENEGYVQNFFEVSGTAINTGEVKNVTMEAGTFTGKVKDMSNAAHIEETYYGLFTDALKAATDGEKDVTLVLDRDTEIAYPTDLGVTSHHQLTIDFHGHNMTGAPLQIVDPVSFVSDDDASVDNTIENRSQFTNGIILNKEIKNYEEFVNIGAVNGQVENRATLLNKSHMALVINEKKLTNEGVIEHITFDEGLVDNIGITSSLVMKSGKLSNEGEITHFVMNDGESISTGKVSSLTITGGTFNGTVEETNALARIDATYYPTFEDALRRSEKADIAHTITLCGDIAVASPLTMHHQESLMIDLAGYKMQGAELTAANDVRIVDSQHHGALLNALVNKGTLCLEVLAQGSLTNTSYFNNRGHLTALVTNNGTMTNDGEIDQVMNYQRIENNSLIHQLNNQIDLMNNKNGVIENLESKGTIKNSGMINNLHIMQGHVDSDGVIQTITQESGQIIAKQVVDHLEAIGGHFTGEVKETNAQGSIASTYYATFDELLEQAMAATEDVTMTLNKDVTLDKDLLLTNKNAQLTLDLNHYSMHGASITTINDVVLANSQGVGSHIDNEISNKGTLKIDVEVNGFIVNDATLRNEGRLRKVKNNDLLVNHGTINELINNEKTENTGKMAIVRNSGRFTNGENGDLDLYHQDAGETVNKGRINDATIENGSLSNTGVIVTLSQNNGAVDDQGEIKHVILTSGTYQGTNDAIDSVAKIDTHYYGSLTKAIEAANNSDEDVTIVLSRDVFGDHLYEIANTRHSITIDLNGWSIHEGGLKILSQVKVIDSHGHGSLDVPVLNKGTLDNEASCDRDVRSTGSLVNNGYIDTVYNQGTLTNNGQCDTIILQGGHATNAKSAGMIDIRKGTFLNNGEVQSAYLDGGSLRSKGTLGSITIYDGLFDGEAQFVDNYADN